jgi:hypothetical protein
MGIDTPLIYDDEAYTILYHIYSRGKQSAGKPPETMVIGKKVSGPNLLFLGSGIVVK